MRDQRVEAASDRQWLTASGSCSKMLLGRCGVFAASSALHCALTCSTGAQGRTIVKKLYVGNLSFKATEEEIGALFAEIGVQPDSLTLLRDRFTGQPRGFGFAEIKDDAEAEKAIAALNGKDFLGRALVVNEARPQRESGGSGGGRGGHGAGGGGAVVQSPGNADLLYLAPLTTAPR